MYLTLDIAPSVWRRINAALSGKGAIPQYIFYSTIGCCAIYYMVLVKKEKRVFRYVFFALCVLAFLLMVKMERTSGEKVHMAQYGLLAFLLYKALRIDIPRRDPRLYLYGCTGCVTIGTVDELIQLFLPHRFFTAHDIFVNALSGVLVFLFIRFNVIEPGA
jgi:hypothetical protein